MLSYLQVYIHILLKVNKNGDGALRGRGRGGGGGYNLGILCILYDDQQVVSIRRYHDLVLLGANPEEREIICGVQLFEHGLCLIDKVVEEAAVLDGGGVVQRRLDGHPLVVHHNGPNHTLMGNEPFQGLLDFGRHFEYLELSELL